MSAPALRYDIVMKAEERSKFVLGFLFGCALGAAAPAVVAVPATALLIAVSAARALRTRHVQPEGSLGAPRHDWDEFLRTAAMTASLWLLYAQVFDWLPDVIPVRMPPR
jgi:hypothetical protein